LTYKELAYNDTLVVLASVYPHTFSPAFGITALNIDSISISGNQSIPAFSIGLSGGVTLPFEFKWDGATATPEALWFYITADNTALHADDFITNMVVGVSSTGTALSAGLSGSETMIDGTWTSSIGTITALGDAGAPSGVSGFTITTQDQSLLLSWTNSIVGDVSGTIVKRSLTGVPSAYSEGTTVYNGALATYTDGAANDSNQNYFYAAFAYDNVGSYATLSDGATGSASPQFGIFKSLAEHSRLYEQGII